MLFTARGKDTWKSTVSKINIGTDEKDEKNDEEERKEKERKKTEEGTKKRVYLRSTNWGPNWQNSYIEPNNG